MATITLLKKLVVAPPTMDVAALPQGTIFVNASTNTKSPSTYIRLTNGVASLNGGYFWSNDELAKSFKTSSYRVLSNDEYIQVGGR